MSADEGALRPETLGSLLRRLRARSERTVREVADALNWSSSKLSRIETSLSGIKQEDLTQLLDLYEASDGERSAAHNLVRHPARRSSGPLDALPDVYEQYARLEAFASRISMYAAVVVPGLLQTAEYAAALINTTPFPEEQFATARIDIRMLRQGRIFARTPPLVLDVVIDEAVLLRPIGGKNIMRRQMIRLQELSDRPETTIRIVPFSVGAHPALPGPFAILDFPENGENQISPHVFCDDLTGGLLRSDEAEVARYRASFRALDKLALDTHKSAKMIEMKAAGTRSQE